MLPEQPDAFVSRLLKPRLIQGKPSGTPYALHDIPSKDLPFDDASTTKRTKVKKVLPLSLDTLELYSRINVLVKRQISRYHCYCLCNS